MLQWFKKHREFLQQESTALSNDSNYKELYQCRNNLFISHGNIIVRYNGTHRFPILIIYTDATPYRLPLIFPLQREFSKQGVEELSTLSIVEAIEKIKPVIKFYYELRHQNSTGVLCFLEWESLDTGSKFFGITTILQRVRDWYAAHFTNEFPPDSQEVDFISHFTFINEGIKILYPEQFLDPKLVEGDCYATLNNIIPKTSIPEFKAELLIEEPEKKQKEKLDSVGSDLRGLLKDRKYYDAINLISSLTGPINHFFDHVLVMDKQEEIKQNRLALLNEIWRTVSSIADFSKLSASQ